MEVAVITEIAEYNPVAAGLAELKRKYANVAVDVSTTKALDEAKRVRAEIREPRYETEKIRKALKAPALAHAKLIDTEAARITTELLAIETPWDEAIKAEEARKEAEKAAKEAAEKARIMAITERIAGIRQYVELAASCRTSARIQELQDKLAAMKIEGFDEFEQEATQVLKQTGDKVEAILTARLEQEAEQQRIKDEQATEAAKLAAARAAFEAEQAVAKLAADQAAAAAKAEADRVAAEQAAQAAAARAELDRQRAELEAARAAHMAEIAAAKVAAEAAEAARVEALREIETPPAPEAVDAALDDASTCCAPDGICTDACSRDDAREEAAMWNAITAKEPTDADVMWICISAVAKEYGWTTAAATERLAKIAWTV